MELARALAWVGVAGMAAGVAACAGILGADFSDVTLGGGAGPAIDSGSPGSTDSGPVIVADGGSCPSGLADCGGVCVDLASSPAHCGKCGTACPSDPHGPAVCVASSCSFACEPGWGRCALGCCSTNSTDASSVTDSGPALDGGRGDLGIACGSAHCAAGVPDFCCGGGINGTGIDACDTQPSDNCPYELFCDDAADCAAGSVCCYDPAPSVTSAICQTSCTGQQVQLCNPVVTGECLGALSCTGTFQQTGLQTTYSTCQ